MWTGRSRETDYQADISAKGILNLSFIPVAGIYTIIFIPVDRTYNAWKTRLLKEMAFLNLWCAKTEYS
ncbi:MAG: hypothetical protein MIO93_13555 [ANME-2 cluster archaeon]|nr:hypothetical protein [ANME-2 cluster archaeon]